MRILDFEEVDEIIARGRKVSDSVITRILDELEKDHPGVYRLIYGEPSDAIAAVNQDMANLYLNLCFDVVWLFRDAFGNPPSIKDEKLWVEKKLLLINVELKSISAEVVMHDKIRAKIQNRLVNSCLSTSIQFALLGFIENGVNRYVSFDSKRARASQLTKNLLFVLVRLMGELYKLKEEKSA